jgi:hypothetical protein
MPVLELINAACFSILLSNLLLGSDTSAHYSGRKVFAHGFVRWRSLAALLSINVVLMEHSFFESTAAPFISSWLASVRSVPRLAFAYVAAPAIWLAGTGSKHAGTAVLATLLVVLPLVGCIAGVLIRRDHGIAAEAWLPPVWLRVASVAIFALVLVSLLFSGILSVSDRESSDLQLSILRTSFIICGFVALTFFEARRTVGAVFGARALAFELARACPIVLSIFPLMSITIGMVFLLMITVFDALGIETQILNKPIYYGALYGPCFGFYFQVKRHLRHAALLPT